MASFRGGRSRSTVSQISEGFNPVVLMPKIGFGINTTGLNPSLIWLTVERDLPPLKLAIEKTLASPREYPFSLSQMSHRRVGRTRPPPDS